MNCLPHCGQILTTRKTVICHARETAYAVSRNTVLLIAMGTALPDYHLRLYSVCARLYYLSKLVYRGKNGVVKLSAQRYAKELFEGLTGKREDVASILESFHNSPEGDAEIIARLTEYTHHCLHLIKRLWCTFIACTAEQAYIPEFAYAFEYVMKNRGDLPMPEYRSPPFFPSNYKDFNYTEGIAACFNGIMESVF